MPFTEICLSYGRKQIFTSKWLRNAISSAVWGSLNNPCTLNLPRINRSSSEGLLTWHCSQKTCVMAHTTAESLWDRKPPGPCSFTNTQSITFNVCTVNSYISDHSRQKSWSWTKTVCYQVLVNISKYGRFLCVLKISPSSGLLSSLYSNLLKLSLSRLNTDSLMTAPPHEISKSFKIYLGMQTLKIYFLSVLT